MEVKGKSAFEVSSLLQGPNGTSVTIQVLDSESKLVWHCSSLCFSVFQCSSLILALLLSGQAWKLWACWINRGSAAICCSHTSLLPHGTNRQWCYSCWVHPPQRVQCIGQKGFSQWSAFLSLIVYYFWTLSFVVSSFMWLAITPEWIMNFAAMKRLQDMGASYFILDLRDNLGGLVQVAFPYNPIYLYHSDSLLWNQLE